jgi:hypothetical protein
MIKTEQVVRLILDGAEITSARGRDQWQIAGLDVLTQTLLTWENNHYIKRDFRRFDADKELYKLTELGRESLIRIYFPDQQAS